VLWNIQHLARLLPIKFAMTLAFVGTPFPPGIDRQTLGIIGTTTTTLLAVFTLLVPVSSSQCRRSAGTVRRARVYNRGLKAVPLRGVTKYRKGPQRSITLDHRGLAIMRELPYLQQFCLIKKIFCLFFVILCFFL